RYFDRRSRRALDARAVLVEADVLMAELADIRRGAVDDKGNETCFFRRVFHLFYETAARRAVYAALRIDEVILQRCRAVEIFRQIGTAFEPRRELAGGEIGSQHSRFSHKISGVWELGIWDWLRNCHGVYPDGDPCFLISDFDQIGRAERVGYALLLAIDRFCVREAQVIKLQQ